MSHWGDSYKYSKRIFCEEMRTKQDRSYISVCSLSILYNSKLSLMAQSLGINAVLYENTPIQIYWKIATKKQSF